MFAVASKLLGTTSGDTGNVDVEAAAETAAVAACCISMHACAR